MRKTEVYSWRLSPAKKRALEDQARAQGQTVAQLLDRLTEEIMAQIAALLPPERRGAYDRQIGYGDGRILTGVYER